jgi:MYXO-CTERM domain-containing protein
MKHALLILLTTLVTSSVTAATGFFGGLYVITSANGGGNVFNQVVTGVTPGSGAASGHNLADDGPANPSFGSFGTFTEAADSLVLKGFEYKTFNNNSSNVTHANLYYRIFATGSPSGSFSNVQTSSPIAVSGNDKTWQVVSGTTNLLNGLAPGSYTMEIYTESYTNGVNSAGNIFGFSSGNNPTATFTVAAAAVPEPSRVLLGLLGVGLIAVRRRR